MSVELQQEAAEVYPPQYLETLHIEAEEVREKIKCGEQPMFDNVDALFEKLKSEE